MIYQGIVLFQLLIVIASFFFLIYVTQRKNSSETKLLMISAFLSMLMNVEYLTELVAGCREAAITAMRFKYVGAIFIGTVLLIFTSVYCRCALSRRWQILLYSWDMLVLIHIWTSDYHNLYYKSVVRVTDGDIPHLQYVHGPLYYVNIVVVVIQLVWAMSIAFKGWRHGHSKKFKNSCAILLIGEIIPIIALPFHVFDIVDGYEPLVPFASVGLMVFYMFAAIQDIFDISEVAHENIFYNMEEPIIILDINYGFVEANSHAEAIFPSLRTCEPGELLPEHALLAYVRTGNMDKLYLHNYVYDVHVDRIYDANQPIGYSILLTDFTEEYNQMKRIHALMTEAKEADQAKTDFLASMSHEIRTPINSIIGMNEMIIRETTSSDVRKYAHDVKNAASMLLSLINDILDSSKIASGKLNIVPVKYSLSEMITDLYNMTSVRAKQKNLKLTFEVSPDLPSKYKGDDVRIRQVLINLLTNAIKYSDQGSVTLRVSGAVENNTAHLRFSVKDTGHGIRKEHMDRIFSRFARIDEERNHHIEGTGLGLSVSVQLLELMGSEMKIDSQVGVGSDFYFELRQPILDDTPIGDFNERNLSRVEEEAYDVTFEAPDAKVLVVDDNEMNLRVFCNLLKSTKIQITKASSGMECINLVRSQHFDIIFLDHMMPEMDGVETLKRMDAMIENPCKDTPVIMITANAMVGAKEQYISLGFKDFLSKPVFADQLESMIKKYLPSSLVKKGDVITSNSHLKAKVTKVPEIEEIDYEYAMAVWKSEDAFYNALQDIYDNLPKVRNTINGLVDDLEQEEALKAYKMHLHTLKGISAMVGALLLSKLARIMEVAADNNQVERLRMLHPILMEEMDKHRERLSVVAPEKSKGTSQEVYDVLNMLRDALEREDYTMADFLVKQLDMFEAPEQFQERLSKLYDGVRDLETKQALSALEEIIQDNAFS